LRLPNLKIVTDLNGVLLEANIESYKVLLTLSQRTIKTAAMTIENEVFDRLN